MRSISASIFRLFRSLVAVVFLANFLPGRINVIHAESQSNSASSPSSIVLLPSQATIIGTAKITRGNDHLDVIGYWKNPGDRVEWTASFPSPGVYDIFLDYSQHGADPGSLMELALGEEKLQARLRETEDWENPCYHFLGQVQIRQAGGVPVKLAVIEKRGNWVMSVRLIRIALEETP